MADNVLGIGIVGCGLIGRKRAASLPPEARLRACADTVAGRADELARSVSGAVAFADWRQVVEKAGVDLVIVATTNDRLAEIAGAALAAGKHVLIEKPAARNVGELERVIGAARAGGGLARVGFNHRYHPALLKAREIFLSGALGEMFFVRGRYGHGGRLGYEKEWRADPTRAGGGELLDQGVHLIDLARWFLGDFTEVDGFINTYFWKMPVEDNAFMLLKTARRQAAFLQVSCTEWKNLFSLEIYGRNGKLHVEGLGGSYGLERLYYYRMRPEMGPPDISLWEYPLPDNSWRAELREFVEDIRLKRAPAAGLDDARAALQVVAKIYAGNPGSVH